MLILGIDPGLSGAIAWFQYDPLSLHVEDIPTFRKGNRRVLDLASLANELSLGKPDFAIIERVGSMPGQGVASTFKFGEVYGALQGMIAMLGYPMHYVTPRVWKAHYGVTRDKDAARMRASELMPFGRHWWTRKKDDGRAEAAMIALYGYQKYGGNKK